MLGLLILVFVAHALQPEVVPTGFRTLFSGKDRSSMFIGLGLDPRAQAITFVFNLGVFAMAVYVTIINVMAIHSFHAVPYLFVVLLTLAMLIIRALVQAFVGYTFFTRGALDTLVAHYYNLSSCTAIVLYPVVLISLFFPGITPTAIFALNAAVFALYLLILLIKCSLILVRSLRGFLYTLLYLVTVEVIPTILLAYASYLLIIN